MGVTVIDAGEMEGSKIAGPAIPKGALARKKVDTTPPKGKPAKKK